MRQLEGGQSARSIGMKAFDLGIALVGMAASSILLASPAEASPKESEVSEGAKFTPWRDGVPPAPDRQIRFDRGDHVRWPELRWAVNNYRQLLPSMNVWRGTGKAAELPYALRDDIDAVTFSVPGQREPMTWAESLAANYTDSVLILHRGKIVYERYLGHADAYRPHLSFSVTKSYFGTLAATLIADGRLDPDARVDSILPELRDSGFGDATVRQVLDMTTELDYDERYRDATSGVFGIIYSSGIRPRPAGYEGPETLYDFLKTIKRAGPHGQDFTYASVNTEVVGWIIGRVTRKHPVEYLSERIWQRLGAEMDAYMLIDPDGMGIASMGFNPILRDQARFGEMLRLNGRYNGQQIIPASVVEDIRKGGDRAKFRSAGNDLLNGWSYRNQWWVDHLNSDAFSARGVYGQAIYVDPEAEMVIVRFASYKGVTNKGIDPTSLPAYRAVARHLNTTPE